ncbi:MAG: hypothetical protein LBU39_04385 [Desulfobulbaceae bacterium]|jgi:hypothetical protein|nr:hypothetical protein [Desulfobulbaceae bacterium]
MTDVWFSEDLARTVDLNLIEIPDEIAALPDVTAFGNVHDLQQAMARDENAAHNMEAAEVELAGLQAADDDLVLL